MDNKIIYLLKKTILYKWYHQYNLKKINKENGIRRAYFLEEAEQLLNKFTISLNNSNILFWLDYGTLLGYYREKDFIKHDNDLDIGARIEDAEKIRTVLTNNGFKLVHQYHSSNGGIEECYKYLHTCVDVFYYKEDVDKQTIYCTTYITRRYLFPSIKKRFSCWVKRVDFPMMSFKRVKFKNMSVFVPEDAQSYLKCVYGENFMTPDPSYDSKNVATNITYYQYKDVQGTLMKYDIKY